MAHEDNEERGGATPGGTEQGRVPELLTSDPLHVSGIHAPP